MSSDIEAALQFDDVALRFELAESRLAQVDMHLEGIDNRLDGLSRTLVAGGLTLSVTMVIGFSTILASVFLAAS